MKKRRIATTLAISAILTAAPVLGACSGDHYDAVKFDAQDTAYAVTSQGGSMVAYGNYIYFINGTDGYEDAEGKSNIWKSAVKGGLCRAELSGEKKDGAPASFSSVVDENGIELKYEKTTDYFDDSVDLVKVTSIAPKRVGTSGYKDGGIFIYDDYAYFASPNNTKNATGAVQTTRTDFFMMPLSGGAPKLIYTTSEGVDTSSSAYAFYKFADKVYLVVNEGSNIVSVGINAEKAKISDPNKFEVNATSVYFPVRDTYYKGIDNNTPEDFIYFIRAVTEDDKQRAGTVLEAMRPDGSENFVVSMNGNTETIEAVRDGILFYRTTSITNETVIAYTNLHEQLLEKSPTYKQKQEELKSELDALTQKSDKSAADVSRMNELGECVNSQVSGVFATAVSDSITATYPFRPAKGSNMVYFLGVTDSAIALYDKNGTVKTVVDSKGTINFIDGNYVYYTGESNDYYRAVIWSNVDGYGEEAKLLATSATSDTFGLDYAAGYIMYFETVDKWASNYSYFVKIDGIEGLDPIAVYLRSEADTPTEEQIEAAKNGEDETTDGETEE